LTTYRKLGTPKLLKKNKEIHHKKHWKNGLDSIIIVSGYKYLYKIGNSARNIKIEKTCRNMKKSIIK
jgi:hypothetical protein